MRDVYDNHSKYVGMSRKLKKHILKNFTEEQMTTQFANAVWEGDNAFEEEVITII
jgi:hypothetical protein